MLRRLLAIIALTFVPTTTVLALSDAPPPDAPTSIEGALFDKVAKTTLKSNTAATQGILAYNISFHDDKYQYSVPLCIGATLVEVDGRTIDPISFLEGDTVVVGLRPNAATDAKSCASRVVRQKISRGASQGECLQDYQVLHEIEGAPTQLTTKYEYTYVLSIYNRPTLACDGKAYGSSPITTTVAAAKPFIVYVDRTTPTGTKELMRWSLTTNAGGKARINYTFAAPSNSYVFHAMPGGTATAGDSIDWPARVVDLDPSPSPTPTVGATGVKLSTTPIIIVLVLVLIGAGGAEYWHWTKRKRENESPEQEYQRIQRL